MAPRADPALMEDGGASADDASIGAVLNTLAKVNRKPGSLARPLSIPNAKMPTDIGDEALVTDTGYLWLRLSKQGDGSWRRCGAAALHFLLRGLFGKRPRGRRLARPRRGSAAPARPPGKSVSPGRLNRRGRLRDVYWFGHGRRVKSALIREVGVRPVHVMIEDCDRFGRMVGTVTCDGRDVGEWLVREGDAIATYDDRYERVEREARRTKRGIWAHTVNTDPRRWRCRSASRN